MISDTKRRNLTSQLLLKLDLPTRRRGRCQLRLPLEEAAALLGELTAASWCQSGGLFPTE